MISVFHNPVHGKSAYLGAINRDKPFVIGFRSRKLAEYTYQRIHPMRLPDLRHQRLVDATDEFNMFLQQVDVPAAMMLKNFQMDADALLTIPKHTTMLDSGIVHEVYDILEIPDHEFMMYPFEKFTGIVIPTHISKEDDTHLYFSSYMIDPAESHGMFMSSLPKLE